MTGIEKLLRGVIRYRNQARKTLLEQIEHAKDSPRPNSVFFTCIDSRVLATTLIDSKAGENYVIRSAGNLIPHSKYYSPSTVTSAPGALEVGCLMNKSQHVVVCGHSDCKAVNYLYNIRNECNTQEGGPLALWLKKCGKESVLKFSGLTEENKFQGPLSFQVINETFKAYIDPQNKYSFQDKLSQVSCLQQIENISSYEFLREDIVNKEVKLHAMWFDITSGEVYMFSRLNERFMTINEDSLNHFLKDSEQNS